MMAQQSLNKYLLILGINERMTTLSDDSAPFRHAFITFLDVQVSCEHVPFLDIKYHLFFTSALVFQAIANSKGFVDFTKIKS